MIHFANLAKTENPAVLIKTQEFIDFNHSDNFS